MLARLAGGDPAVELCRVAVHWLRKGLEESLGQADVGEQLIPSAWKRRYMLALKPDEITIHPSFREVQPTGRDRRAIVEALQRWIQ